MRRAPAVVVIVVVAAVVVVVVGHASLLHLTSFVKSGGQASPFAFFFLMA